METITKNIQGVAGRSDFKRAAVPSRSFLTKQEAALLFSSTLSLLLPACNVITGTPTTPSSLETPPPVIKSPVPPTQDWHPSPEPQISQRPSVFEELYYGTLPGTDSIIGAVPGTAIASENPGYTVPIINGINESRTNSLYNPNFPNLPWATMIDQDWSKQVFQANSDPNKGGIIVGHLSDGSEVQLIDNMWVRTSDSAVLNPVVVSRAGHPFGWPVLVKNSLGELFIGITDDNGVLVKNSSWESAFQSPQSIARDTGYQGDMTKVTSVGFDRFGNIKVMDQNGTIIQTVRYLNPNAPTETPTPTATAKPTETLIPTPTESVSPEFWEALKVKQGGDWSKYIRWNERYKNWSFRYAVDGTAVRNVPIPGLEGVVADLAVRAYYYDVNGDKQTILVAMVIKLPDGTFSEVGRLSLIQSQVEIDQRIKDHPGSFQIGEPGLLPGATIMKGEDLINQFGEWSKSPDVQAYLQFVQVNQTALDEFLETGSPTLKIIFPSGLSSSGGYNILNDYILTPPTP